MQLCKKSRVLVCCDTVYFTCQFSMFNYRNKFMLYKNDSDLSLQRTFKANFAISSEPQYQVCPVPFVGVQNHTVLAAMWNARFFTQLHSRLPKKGVLDCQKACGGSREPPIYVPHHHFGNPYKTWLPVATRYFCGLVIERIVL